MKAITAGFTRLAALLCVIVGVAGVMGTVISQEHGGEDKPSEHAGEPGEGVTEASEGTEAGEEDGAVLAIDAVYDEVRNGARLVLAYDAASASFIGSVENVTGQPLENVRVEVHLSNGLELGPTTPVDLAPGESVEVSLTVFDGWVAHAEVGASEANHASDRTVGRSSEGSGEHGGREGSSG